MDIDEDAAWGDRQLAIAPVDYTTASTLLYDLLHRKRDTVEARPRSCTFRATSHISDESANTRVENHSNETARGVNGSAGGAEIRRVRQPRRDQSR